MTFEDNPHVIVTDSDLVLMNVINNVFLKTYHMLCQFHNMKNVKAKCKMLVDFVEAWNVLMEAWKNVMDCEEESMFSAYVDRLLLRL